MRRNSGTHRLDLLATSERASKARTIAPRLLAVPIAASPATPRRPRGPGRRDLAGRGDLAGEERAELVGRLDDGAVAGDVGHRGEHVERLGPEMRGTASIASAVTPAAVSRPRAAGLRAGER